MLKQINMIPSTSIKKLTLNNSVSDKKTGDNSEVNKSNETEAD